MYITGYQIIDLHNIDIKTGARNKTPVSGVFAAISAAGCKPLLFVNIKINGTIYSARYVCMDLLDTKYCGILTIGLTSYKVTIDNNDNIIVKE